MTDTHSAERAARSAAGSAAGRSTPAGRVRRLWDQARDVHSPQWPPRWLPIAAALAVVGGLLLWAVPHVVAALYSAVDRWAGPGGQWGQVDDLAGVPFAGLRAAMRAPDEVLPVSAPTLMWTWLVAGGALFLAAAVGRSPGARIGWAVYGAATLALVWNGTPTLGRVVAAAVTAVWWAVLSVLAYRRRIRLESFLPDTGPPPLLTPSSDAGNHHLAEVTAAKPDEISRVTGAHELLLRRQQITLADRPASGRTWTVTTRGRNGYRAISETGTVVTGLALSGEALTDVLGAVDCPPVGHPTLIWDGPAMPAPHISRLNGEDWQTPGTMRTFLDSSDQAMRQLVAAIRLARARWDPDRVAEQIAERATELNRSRPLCQAHHYRVRTACPVVDHGFSAVLDWVDPATVIGGSAQYWNDFANHRPSIVGDIITSLLTTHDPQTMITQVLAADSIAYLHRIHGPAGPLHWVSVNGNHRTHAFRILGAPLIAAEVTTSPLPLQVPEHATWDERDNGPARPLWEGLIARRLLTGRIRPTTAGPILEPHHSPAPWLLLNPHDVIEIAAAYERTYPGSLAAAGIPATAYSDTTAWRRWLTSRP